MNGTADENIWMYCFCARLGEGRTRARTLSRTLSDPLGLSRILSDALSTPRGFSGRDKKAGEGGASRAERAEWAERAEQAEWADRAERAERTEWAGRAERAEQMERAEGANSCCKPILSINSLQSDSDSNEWCLRLRLTTPRHRSTVIKGLEDIT